MYMSNMGFLQVIVTQTLWIKHLFIIITMRRIHELPEKPYMSPLPELVWVPISDKTPW